MDEVDLRDTRGRLRRLAIAAGLGLILTVLAMAGIHAVSDPPNADPIGGSIAILLAIAMFAISTATIHRLIARRRTS